MMMTDNTHNEDFSEWDRFENLDSTYQEVVSNDAEHKVWIVSNRFMDKDVLKMHDLLQKELALSNIPDAELAYIYAVKMDCIEEWLRAGFQKLAKERMMHMLFRLNLFKSVQGRERWLQAGPAQSVMSWSPEEMRREEMFPMPEEQMMAGRPMPGIGGLRSAISKFRDSQGGKKRWWQEGNM